MTLEYVPLLKVQRDLSDLPRGIERFREYIQTMTGGGDELKLPLVAMNPMGKGHLPPFLDHLLAIDADDVGARALADASRALADEPGDYRACLVVSDDRARCCASTCPRPITRRSSLRSSAMRPLASSDISRSDSLRAPALRSQRRDSDLSMLAMI